MMDNISIILEWDRSPVHKAAGKPETRSVSTAKPDINAAIAARIHAIRDARGLSIESVADKSGVSRSMISLIERGETSPTAALLEKLAAALGTTLARLFEPEGEPSGPVTRKADQPLWRDPASGYVRRNVSPAGTPIQIVEISFPPGARSPTIRPG